MRTFGLFEKHEITPSDKGVFSPRFTDPHRLTVE
jgi:hypothetical protein